MSRPYFNINSMSFAGPTLSMNWTYYKLRGGGTFSIAGLSNSVSFNSTDSSSDFKSPVTYANGSSYDVTDITVGSLGTSSTTTYVAPTLTLGFGGTVSATTNVKTQLFGVQLSSFTASLGVNGPTLSNFLTALAASYVYTGAAAGFSAVAGATQIVLTAPTYTGNMYNGLTVSETVVIGASSFTYSTTTFSGGANLYEIVMTYPKLGSSDTYIFSV